MSQAPNLFDKALADVGDDDLAPGRLRHQSFPEKSSQGLAHWRARHFDSASKVLFSEKCAGAELAVENQPSDLVVRQLPRTLSCRWGLPTADEALHAVAIPSTVQNTSRAP